MSCREKDCRPSGLLSARGVWAIPGTSGSLRLLCQAFGGPSGLGRAVEVGRASFLLANSAAEAFFFFLFFFFFFFHPPGLLLNWINKQERPTSTKQELAPGSAAQKPL